MQLFKPHPLSFQGDGDEGTNCVYTLLQEVSRLKFNRLWLFSPSLYITSFFFLIIITTFLLYVLRKRVQDVLLSLG